MNVVFPLLIGAISAIYVQTLVGWWMNSGFGVASMLTATALLAVLCYHIGTGRPYRRLYSLWWGIQIGLTWYLFTQINPGTIFPITMFIGALLTANAIVFGAYAGSFLSRERS